MNSKTAKRNRIAGHNYERKIAQEYRDAGFEDTITSRLGSLLHDSAKIDLTRLPFFPQCKYGYKSMSVNNYIQLFNDMDMHIKNKKITENFPKVIHHRRSAKKNEDLVIMTRQDFFNLIKNTKKINKY